MTNGGEGSEDAADDVDDDEDDDEDDDDEDEEEVNMVRLYSPREEGKGPALELSTTVTIGGREAPPVVDAAAAAAAAAAEMPLEEEEEDAVDAGVWPVLCSCSSAWRKPRAYCSCSSVTFFGKRNCVGVMPA